MLAPECGPSERFAVKSTHRHGKDFDLGRGRDHGDRLDEQTVTVIDGGGPGIDRRECFMLARHAFLL
jgi:hypothetical protein